MALTISNNPPAGGGRIHHITSTRDHLLRRVVPFPSSTRNVSTAAKKFSSRTGRLDNKKRKGNSTLTTIEEDQKQERTVEMDEEFGFNKLENIGSADGYVVPDLPGLEPDFWEGPNMEAFGFFMQYMWAFGIGFALIACGVAVATYNEGATDFKETPAYKESVQSRDLLQVPEESNSDVFESNPTEVAPSLD